MREKTAEKESTDTAVCPHCGKRTADFETMEIDAVVVDEQSKTVGVVVCPSCEKVVGAYSDYQRSDLVEGGEAWGRVKGVDE